MASTLEEFDRAARAGIEKWAREHPEDYASITGYYPDERLDRRDLVDALEELLAVVTHDHRGQPRPVHMKQMPAVELALAVIGTSRITEQR